jgi:hypothetical protein
MTQMSFGAILPLETNIIIATNLNLNVTII